MLLQIDKVLRCKEEVLRTDIVEGVKRTNQCGNNFVVVQFENGTVNSFCAGELDNSFDADASEEFKQYVIKDIWLLSDKGKTLRKLL